MNKISITSTNGLTEVNVVRERDRHTRAGPRDYHGRVKEGDDVEGKGQEGKSTMAVK